MSVNRWTVIETDRDAWDEYEEQHDPEREDEEKDEDT